MPIAELFLSIVVKTLVSELASHVLSEYARINGISEKLKSWKLKLQIIQTVMDSAEERQKDGNCAVDLWLANLRDVAYDMEDLLDHFNVEARRSEFKAQTPRSARLPSCLIACCSKIDPCTLLQDHRMANEIEEVDRRLEEVLQHKQYLPLDENFRSSLPVNSGQPRLTTTSLPEPKFVGREKHMEELLDRLTRIQETQDPVRPFTVVSIVGMGGLGKTTLAQQLYNHESVSNTFKLKAWVCVSAAFDSVAITKSVLQWVDPSSSCMGKDLNWLQSSLKQQLSGKKFLIVLDDVWNENYVELESLFKPFYSGSSGSRILLTMRNRHVAKMARDLNPMELDLLSTNDCLSLLAYHAFDKDNFNSLPHLKDVAVKLVEKCKGLPLAVKTIGGLLFGSRDEQWQQVLDNGIWTGEGGQEKIPPALKLSYVYLPTDLKRCFAACALFPKDYVFEGDELVQIWIVQGLLRKGNAKTYRDVGMNYLGQLVARSLLQKAGDKKTQYSMHDLINDLAKSVVGVTYFSSDEYRESSNEATPLANVRHAAMVAVNHKNIPVSKIGVYHSMKKLRTFMPFQTSKYASPNIWVSKKVLHALIMGMKHLRILSFRYFFIWEVPDLFGELKLLRSLDFSYTEVEVLPESICDLVELQYLLLRGCQMLKKLPRNIHKLTNLLHLDITDTVGLKEMPPHISSLTNLEILSSFVVGKEAGQELKELGKLKCLEGELHIRNLLEVNNVGDAKIANIHGKEGVSKLSLDWGSKVEISLHGEHQLELLNHLQPPRKIESLGIYHYGGIKFPSWFGNSCLENVVSITLTGCNSVESLPPFGRLPSLDSLNISKLDAVSMIGDEFYGTLTPFRSLRSLSFCNMISWKEWSSSGNCENDHPFPRLRKLTLGYCPELKRGLPGRLDSLYELEIIFCPFLSASGDDLSLSSLGKLHFSDCNNGLLKCLVGTTCMTAMFIQNVPQLVRFGGRLSSALEVLSIDCCPLFKSFEDEDGREQVPPKLKKLVITNCADLERLPDDLSGLTSLNEMTVSWCRNLSSFPSVGLPPALRILMINECPSLLPSQFLTMKLLKSLKELILQNLEGLMSIEDVIIGTPLSQSLRKLCILGCGSLTTIPDSLQQLSALSELHVSNCKALDLDCFPPLPCNLITFSLGFCPKVKSLPQDMHHLTSLQDLGISYCDGIKCLPRGGLPPNLEILTVCRCRMMNQPLEEWGLAGLTSLREFLIEGEMGCVDEMVSFPSSSVDDSDAWRRLLPSSLVRLSIHGMKNVVRLSQGLRVHLSSLEVLSIRDCVKMRELPEEGLPDSLERLRIVNCGLLGERCKEPNGDYWQLIQLIPDVIIG